MKQVIILQEEYFNQVENRIIFRINTGYYLILLMPVLMKLLGSIKIKITKDGNGENLPFGNY